MHVLYHMNAHIHPRPAAGTRSKGPSHGAKLWARATIGSTNLQAAGCYRYMLSSLLGETPYIFIYTQFVHHFFKEILDLLHVQNFSPPLLVPCRHNMYDGNEEFWVIVKESGKRQESHSYEEIQQKRAKAIFFWGWTYTFMDDVSIVTRKKESL